MVIALVLVSAGVVPGVTSAQDGDNTTEATTTMPDDGNASTIQADLGSGVTLVDMEYSPGRIVLIVEADLSGTLLMWQDSMGAMKEANRRSSNSGLSAVDMAGYQHEVWLDQGTNRVVLDVETWRGTSTVSVWTTEKEFVISKELPSSNPLEAFGGTQGVFAGVGTSVLAALTATGLILRKERGEVIEA
ncbi:hypothetical protein SAMN05192554_11412 [Haloarchaeobius iranensis]|uniref:Uncharacterized protein n=2 Tax=Haloarchaeobius iranensis TaxID=996166 RepID=A0A1G9YDF1_9EURY|nr:hypothetical protein SAMN05192554_11412 [Haloarchaeobius iranensis]